MKQGQVIELRGAEHGDFVHNQTFQRDIARAMRKFLLGE